MKMRLKKKLKKCSSGGDSLNKFQKLKQKYEYYFGNYD